VTNLDNAVVYAALSAKDEAVTAVTPWNSHSEASAVEGT
jgi:hypothetical protein